MPSLEEKTIVITGGSMGIGLACARKCTEEGATVIIAARNADSLDSALTELNEGSEGTHFSYQLDVSDNDQVVKFAEWCGEEFDGVDGVVNCAGIYGSIGKIQDLDIELFTKTVNINLMGTVYMCRAFVPILKGQGRKKIVNFSGGGAAAPFPRYSAYAVSKAAVVRLTENLAVELDEDGIDVNCIAPGFVATRLHQQTLEAGPGACSESFYETTRKKMEEGGVPPEVAAGLCAFLLSGESDNITGKFIAAPYDPWQEKEFQERLRKEKNLATLRRIDEKFFKETT